MERNVIIAIILSMLVIVGFQLLFSPHKTQTQKKAVTTTQQVVKTEKENFPQKAIVPEQKNYQNIKEAKVDTSLFEAQITEAGARFTHFKLLKYKKTLDPDSPPVDLINSPKFGLPIEVYPTIAPKLAISPYKANPLELTLDKEQKGDILFEPVVKTPLIIDKKFSFKDGSYLFNLDVKIKNPTDKPISDNILFRMASHPVAKLDRYVFRGPAYSHNGIYEEVKLKDKIIEYKGDLDWVAYGDPYFLMAIIPPKGNDWRVTFRRLEGNTDELILWTPKITFAPHEEKQINLKLYFGPKSLDELKKVGYHLDKAIHFGFFDPIAKPLLYALKFFYKYTHNYGISIILLTVLIRIIFWPLNHISMKNMKKMKDLQPIIARLKEKYGDDKEKLNQELMRIYKTYKVNPFMGCLPMIIQIPVFFSLYKVLLMAIELRHAPFFAWIKDLSSPDRLPVGIDIPYLGGIPVLTILMGISMYFQQKLTPTSMDPTQEKMMLLMPIFFTILFVNFPSGLVLYWLTNNILSIVQQVITNKMLERSRA
ncbi:membrane protein insertase, YidC/Oxa1 family [Thermodesulfatator indicus DSM 15286]|uniref:Membrane protein insertase YidC n=1 Tax=Thermodesulfatator indicus (strain DSM 15286 / JCM 11887 / CIR29812) TaxID=667014 RepID=F8ABR1_THEID|nr:membrane protein insertase YidC [Thermodesulfatator indicus]AEH44513.1 membrane protein insertase, YidC/Oxa1 family [Thermodesulfatator indicus DSM 15286]